MTNNVASGLDGFGNRVSRGGGIDNRISPQLTLNRTYVSGNTVEYVGEFTHPGGYINQSAIVNNTGISGAGGIGLDFIGDIYVIFRLYSQQYDRRK